MKTSGKKNLPMNGENEAFGVIFHLPTPTTIIATQFKFSFHICTHKLLLLFDNLVANVGFPMLFASLKWLLLHYLLLVIQISPPLLIPLIFTCVPTNILFTR
jgi:hypothetical protein